jgi:isopentenyl-diphosphate delta-isomerase
MPRPPIAKSRSKRSAARTKPTSAAKPAGSRPRRDAAAPLTASRKDSHIEIVLHEDVAHKTVANGFERYRFDHEALPEMDLADVDLGIELLGKRLAAPLVIGAMTGGTERSHRINRHLAEAAQARGVALALGSARTVLEDPARARTYGVRDVAPDVLLFANLGAVQLRLGVTPDDCRRLVDLLHADALFLHLNPLQEVVQPEGDTTFGGLVERIAAVARALAPTPVLVKEVGAGISAATAALLRDTGIAGIEVAGAGGTSWALIESHRGGNAGKARLGRVFADWGIPTAESIQQVRESWTDGVVIASGGIRDGIESAKALALGATAVASAFPFLAGAERSAEAVAERIGLFVDELRTACFLTRSRTVAELRHARLRRVEPTFRVQP